MGIQIIGNVGNVGYAIPMVSAAPIDVNSQHVLVWSPAAQALDYIKLTVDFAGNMAVLGNLTVAGTLGVAGLAAFSQGVQVIGSTTSTAAVTAGAGAEAAALVPGVTPNVQLAGTQVVGPKITGWGAPTGAATRTTFDTATVTLPQLAERVKALLDNLVTHGLIGP